MAINPTHSVMHGVAIKKNGTLEEITVISGVAPAVAKATMEAAVLSGRIIDVDGRYMLSSAGHMIVTAEYSRFYADLRNDTKFVAAYEQFELINNDLKQLITQWQTVEIGGKRVANDHSDADYDDKVIGRLGDLHERFEPALDALVAGDSRFALYKIALTEALEKAEDGDTAWVSDARTASYHTVWFELHEDLLRVLGHERQE